MTKRRRTPVGTEPPAIERSRWLDGSWISGLSSSANDDPALDLSTVAKLRDEAWVDELRAVTTQLLGAELARASQLPRAITSEPTGEASGTIDTDARVEAHEKAIAQAFERRADEETSVMVQLDEEWLARLDLTGD